MVECKTADMDAELYAKILGYAVKGSIAALFLSYLIYIFGSSFLVVHPETIAGLWSKSSAIYNTSIGSVTSPHTMANSYIIDMVPQLCIMAIATVSLLCALVMAKFYAQRKIVFSFICSVVQIAVFILAMSGIANNIL